MPEPMDGIGPYGDHQGTRRVVIRCLVLALGYFVTGTLAYQLALPPASASPIWPAAGIALVGVLYWGVRVWPGVFLGALLVQVSEHGAMLDLGLFRMPVLGLVGNAIGPTLQALAGGSLIRRTHAFPTRIRRARDIVRRIWLGGPVACVVGATIGVFSLLAMGLIATEQIASTWLVWWFGDALGVLVVLPLAFAWRSDLRTLRPRAHAVVSAVLGAASLFSILAFVSVRDRQWDAAQATLDRRVLEMHDDLDQVVATKAELLWSIAKLYDVTGEMNRARLKKFVARDLQRHPDMKAIGWVSVVKSQDIEAFEAQTRADYPDRSFRVTKRDEEGALVPVGNDGGTWHAVVQFIQPEAGNEDAIGFDLASEDTRRKALENARKSGEPHATGPIALVQDTERRPAILLIAPYEHSPNQIHTEVEPDAFMSGVFQTEDMIEKALGSYRREGVAFRVTDTTEPEASGLLCFEPEGRQPPQDRSRELFASRAADVAGREWTLTAWALPRYAGRPAWWGALAALAGGLFCTALLASLLILMTGNTVRAERANQDLRQEVRERRAAEAALQKSERRFRDIVQSTAEWIWEIDIAGQHVFTNNRLVAILGYEADEILQAETFELLHPSDRDAVRSQLAGHIREKTGWYGWVLRWRHKDGSYRYLESNAQAVLDREGELIGFRGADRDITERQMMQERLLQTQKLESLGVLAGGIAHDFNNLLTAVGGNLDYAMKHPGASNQEALEDARRALERATGLTGQLLTFAKGGAPITQSVDLRDLIRDWSRFALRGSKTGCDVQTPSDLWPAHVDANQISQVIGNLIINADQAMPDGGVIEVRARNTQNDPVDSVVLGDGRFVHISVRDSGAGIDPEIRSRIFDPYFTTKQTGTGLGLATVYSIVKRHGGHLLLDSEPGGGSTFHVYLPAADASAVPVEPESAQSGMARGGRALIMDDAQLIRTFLARALEHLGFEVEVASTGEKAVAMYAEAHASGRPFEVVILDLTVPGGMGGADAVRKMRAIDPSVCAIASSGYSASPVMAHPEEHHFAGVIAKPYTIDQLEAVLGAAMLRGHVGSQPDADRAT